MAKGGCRQRQRARRLCVGTVRLARDLWPCHRIGRGVEQGAGQRHAGLAVKHGMMNLEVVGLGATLEAVEDIHHPQRVRTVEQFGVEIRHHGFELGPGARRRDTDAAYVVIKVDFALQPDRVGQVQRQCCQAPAQDRHHARFHHAAHRIEKAATVAGRRLEQMQRADMHRGRHGFEVEESAVDTAQGFEPGILCRFRLHAAP